MAGPLARILLRVIAGILIGKGWFSPEDANSIFGDPELATVVEMALGGVVWAGTEAWYYIAKRMGWST